MTSYENYAHVYNQTGVQNIHGNLVINESAGSHKRNRTDHNDSSTEKQLDDDILASLAFREMFNRRSQVESAHRQTCQWIFDMEEFRAWKKEPCGLLWIKGKPGSGKSTLMSHVYRALWCERSIDRDINLEFFFNARGVTLQQTPTGMLRSLLSQLFNQDHSVRQYLRATYQEKRMLLGSSNSFWDWQLAELKQIFIDMISASASRRQVTLLIDALDEAGGEAARDTANYFHMINDIVAEQAGAARICISCRHYPIPSNTKAVEIYMERQNHDDITLYIKDLVLAQTTHCEEKRQDCIGIASMLIDKAGGIFQWARLVVPLVLKWMGDGDSMEDIRKGLSKVPSSLGATYEYILSNVIDPRYTKKTLRLFQWVCVARQPLAVIELRYAISSEDLELKTTAMRCDELPDFDKSDWKMVQRIKAWSGGLLEVIPRSPLDYSRVQVIHQSVKDYVVDRGLSLLIAFGNYGQHIEAATISLPTSSRAMRISHRVLYLSCLKYLCAEAKHLPLWEEWPETCSDEAVAILTSLPLLYYSIHHCFRHAAEGDESRFEDLDNETQHLKGSIKMWFFAQDILYTSPDPNRVWWVADGLTVLHLATVANLAYLIRHIVESGDNINAADDNGWTSLHVAIVQGHREVVKLLHEAGADLQCKTTDGDTPLSLAAKTGHVELFVLLMNYGCNLIATDADSLNALYAAADAGAMEICRLCLAAGIDVNAQRSHGDTVLQEATRSVNASGDLVRLLLEAGADPNTFENSGGSALQAASCQWHRESGVMVRLLLEAGADVNAQGGYHGTALQAAAATTPHGQKDQDDTNVIHMLLQAGADVNARGGGWGTALHYALTQDKVQAVRVLLAAGADIDAPGPVYHDALQAAASQGNLNIICQILEAGAGVNTQGGTYGNALQVAATCSRREAVEKLIEAGADINAQGGRYGNALQAAVVGHKGRDHVGIVRLLLDSGVDVNARGGVYGCALRAARLKKDEHIASMLEEAGARYEEHEFDDIETPASPKDSEHWVTLRCPPWIEFY